MGQEWDYPPRRWRTERTRYDMFGPIINHEPRPKTAWHWYLKQMRAKAPMLHKANITALFFTLSGLFYLTLGAGSALSVWIVAKVLF